MSSDTLPATRNPDGTFPVGVSGNPAGRPLGRKNQITELKQTLEIAVRDHMRPTRIRSILDKMCELAEQGHVGAAKLILDKVLSNAKEEDEISGSSGTFIFKVKNLTLKHPDVVEVKATDAIDGEFVEISSPDTQENSVSTGAVPSNQYREQNDAGANLVGKAPSAPVRKVPAFQGRSGQADNSDTNRGAGGK